MKSLTHYLLTESSTADATNTEMAICIAYNMSRPDLISIRSLSDRFAAGLDKAGIDPKKWYKISEANRKKLMKIGTEVTKDSKGAWGNYLSHAGTSSASNHYKIDYGLRATDTTSKSDFTSTSNSAWNISLKKAGDSGPGAQIMSSKAGEAQGIFRAGIGHYENNGGAGKVNAATITAVDQLWDDMAASANNKLVIQVAGGKKDFANWYKQADHSRRNQLATFTPSPSVKQIETHLDAEMDLLGIPSLARKPEKKKQKLLYNLVDKKGDKLFTEPAGFNKIEEPADVSKIIKYEDEYKNDSNWTVGQGYTIKGDGTAVQTKSGRTGTDAVVVNPDHLTNIDQSLLKDTALKKLIANVVETSIATKAWSTTLEDFYKDNDELKKWFLYEAGSGLFKFTGDYSDGKPYRKKVGSPVANKLVVFNNSGVKGKPETILSWAASHTSALNPGAVQISYKTSGISGYAAIRLAAEYESELPLLQEEVKSLQEQIKKIESQYVLDEGVLSWIRDKVSVLLDKIKNAVKRFVENVIKKFIDWLKKLAKKGHDLFMQAMGIEGSIHIPAPRW